MTNKRIKTTLKWAKKNNVESTRLGLHKKQFKYDICKEFDDAVDEIYKEEQLVKSMKGE